MYSSATLHDDPWLDRALPITDFSPHSLAGCPAPRYKFSRDGTHRLGALEPLNTVADLGRNDIGSSGFLPGACDVCPGAPVLKVAGPDCVRCSKPPAGVKGLLPAALAGRGSF